MVVVLAHTRSHLLWVFRAMFFVVIGFKEKKKIAMMVCNNIETLKQVFAHL